jgi:hypothetical protein
MSSIGHPSNARTHSHARPGLSGFGSAQCLRSTGSAEYELCTNEAETPMRRKREYRPRLGCEGLETRQMLSGFYIFNSASGKVRWTVLAV